MTSTNPGFFIFMRRPKKHTFNVDEEDLIEAARIIDKQCWISLWLKGGGYGFSFRLRREDFEDINFMYETFGGYLNRQNLDGETIYWLNIQQGRAWSLLTLVDPYIQRRRLSFEILKKMRVSIDKNRGRRMSDELREYRRQLIDELSEYNRKFFEWLEKQSPGTEITGE